MVEKLKLTTASLEKISVKLQNNIEKRIGVVERKQSSGMFAEKSQGNFFKNKPTKQSLTNTVQKLKEQNPDFSPWTATMTDLLSENTVLSRQQKIALARKAQSIRVNTFINWLSQKYPACFSKERPKPLKIGIAKDILKNLPPQATKILAKKSLAHYANMKNYIKALLTIPYRYDLSGKEAGPVTESEKRQAKEKLHKLSPKKHPRTFVKKFTNSVIDDPEDDNRFNR